MSWILYQLLHTLYILYTLVLIARALLPILGVHYGHPLRRFLYTITEPLLAPIRRQMPPTGLLDPSPMVLILTLWLVDQILRWVLL